MRLSTLARIRKNLAVRNRCNRSKRSIAVVTVLRCSECQRIGIHEGPAKKSEFRGMLGHVALLSDSGVAPLSRASTLGVAGALMDHERIEDAGHRVRYSNQLRSSFRRGAGDNPRTSPQGLPPSVPGLLRREPVRKSRRANRSM